MDLLNKLSITEQLKIYLTWCKDNNKEAKAFNSLKAYFDEIRGGQQHAKN